LGFQDIDWVFTRASFSFGIGFFGFQDLDLGLTELGFFGFSDTGSGFSFGYWCSLILDC